MKPSRKLIGTRWRRVSQMQTSGRRSIMDCRINIRSNWKGIPKSIGNCSRIAISSINLRKLKSVTALNTKTCSKSERRSNKRISANTKNLRIDPKDRSRRLRHPPHLLQQTQAGNTKIGTIPSIATSANLLAHQIGCAKRTTRIPVRRGINTRSS